MKLRSRRVVSVSKDSANEVEAQDSTSYELNDDEDDDDRADSGVDSAKKRKSRLKALKNIVDENGNTRMEYVTQEDVVDSDSGAESEVKYDDVSLKRENQMLTNFDFLFIDRK
jgi:hypothetical protein